MFRGQRIVLRPNEPEHLVNYVRWFSDPDVAHFGPARPLNLEQERAWYERANQDETAVSFAVEYQGQHIGGGGLASIDPTHHSAEVGLFIGEKTLWGQGLGRDVLVTLVGYGFDYLNLHRIYLRVHADNLRAVHLYEKAGFVHEGRFRQAEWRHGRWVDLLYMSILRPEWEARQLQAPESGRAG